MLTALLNLVASVGAVGVLAGVVSGIIFLVDTALQWGSTQRTSLEPWANAANTTLLSAANGAVNGAANGAANGVVHIRPVNGASNGAVNGAANGAVNGAANGAVNGAVNGVLNGGLYSAANGGHWNHHGVGTEVADVPAGWFEPAPDAAPLIRVPLQSLAPVVDIADLRDDVARLSSYRRPRSGAGDGESQCDMGEADDDVPEVLGVRQLMERLVESLVSGGLDDVALRPANPHPQYGRIYKRHQPRLRSALTSLAYSLQMAMAQKPLAECETPGRAHAQLRAIILDLARDVANLEKGGAADGVNGKPVDALDGKEDFATRAYEDILATAIVNKVMERSSTKSNNKRLNNNNNNFVSSLEVRVGSVEDSPESLTSSYTESWTGSGSSHLDHSLEDADSDPLSLMIEECIEEVTTITATSSSSASSSSLDERSEDDGAVVREAPVVRRRRRRRGSRRRGSATAAALPLPPSGPPSLIAGLSLMKQRVPFPELGVDIVDADWSSAESELSGGSVRLRNGSDGDSDVEGWRPSPRHNKPDGAADDDADDAKHVDDADADDDRPASCLELVTPMQSWEDNWLFQSKRVRKPAAQYAHHPVPVPMLVPNPSEDFRALIGDVDAEETSDLSECSDDALEEVVLAGMTAASDDQFSEDIGLSEAAARAHLAGLAETCNLELLRRVAPSLSTAPVPRAHRTDRAANRDQPASPTPSGDRLSPVGKTPSRTSTLSGRSSTRSPVDLAGRWARDQDAEQTVLYDTPTRREAPARMAAAKKEEAAAPVQSKPQDADVAPATPAPAPALPPPAAPTPAAVDVEPEEVEAAVAEVVAEAKVVAEVAAAPAVNGHASAEEADDAVLATPPRPGTIAEREHRKWLEATPLANNPYSPENIQRRLQQRASLRPAAAVLPAASPASAAAPGGAPDAPDDGVDRPDPTLHIALRVDPDPKKYGRDFYINSRTGAQPSGTGSGLRRSQSTSVADRRGSLLDSPIAPWSSSVRTNGDGGAEESLGSPSVRELAKQFLVQPQEPPAPSQVKAKTPDAEAKVVIVGKESAQHAKRAVRQVHSLTARSMSREFREGLRHLAATAAVPVRGATSPSTPSSVLPVAEVATAGGDAAQGRPDPEGARQPVGAE